MGFKKAKAHSSEDESMGEEEVCKLNLTQVLIRPPTG